MRKYSMFVLAAVLGMGSAAYSAPTVQETLKSLAGCFKISYRFVEDGKHDYAQTTYEWVEPIADEHAIAFQHWGVVGTGDDIQTWKHWQEYWTEVEGGKWHQLVLGPSGEKRYECTAPFAFNQWRCAASGAAKPIRDLGRADYDVLDRENTLQITPNTWIQAEKNDKRTKDGKVVANEVGWNEYTRVDEKLCGQGNRR